MKTRLLIEIIAMLVVIISLGKITNAQGGWEEVFSISDRFMRDICFVPGTDGAWNTGWAIAAEGEILKTTDGGETWTTYTQPYSSILGGISFADETTGFICTLDTYQVLKSTDGGETWSVVFTDIGGFDKIAFKDDQNGVVSGSYKHYTSDGGITWTEGTGGNSYWDMDYAGGDTYYGVYLGGSLGQTIDNGATWNNVESLGQMAFMVDFMNENTGMFGGDLSKIMVTQDAGSTWSTNTLGNGQDAINCGGFFDADTVYACGSSGDVFKSTDGGENWDTDTSFASGVFQPRGFVVTGMNVLFACANTAGGDGKVWRKIGAPPIGTDFEASQTEVCAGSSVDFTDLSFGNIDSWSWTFEGGTPSSSTDQNPTITYNTTGLYDVKLVVTVGTYADSLTRTDYIEVVELPAQADMPEGDDAVCTDMLYEYTVSEVEFGKDYEWELLPASVGILDEDGTTAILTVAEDYTGDFTLRVRVGNVCGYGDWSESFEGTVYQSPSTFSVEGGGGYCLDGEGVEITLNGSETDIDYELYLDGVATGNIEAGTGDELSFGLVTEEGFYTVYGSSENCTQVMEEQVEVFILFPPIEPAEPTGPEAVCDESTSTYESEGTEDADSYVWALSPEEAGSISGEGLQGTVTWDIDFVGIAMVSLAGVNDCGEGNYSEVLEVAVGATIPEIIGEEIVCDFSSEVYEVAENEGSTYSWEVNGGSITEGQGTYMITVAWEEEGEGTIIVEEENENGCSGTSENFEVLIDDCTGIFDPKQVENLSVYPNPASNILNINFNSAINTNYLVQVYSQVGQLMYSTDVNVIQGNQTHQINIAHLTKGLYLVVIQNNDHKTYRAQVLKK